MNDLPLELLRTFLATVDTGTKLSTLVGLEDR